MTDTWHYEQGTVKLVVESSILNWGEVSRRQVPDVESTGTYMFFKNYTFEH